MMPPPAGGSPVPPAPHGPAMSCYGAPPPLGQPGAAYPYGPPPPAPWAPPPYGLYGMPPPSSAPPLHMHGGPPPGPYGYPVYPYGCGPPPPAYMPPHGMRPREYGRSLSRSPRGRRKGRGGDDGGRKFRPHHTTSVPKVTDLGAHYTKDEATPPTTAMLRNIPNKYTPESLMEEIDGQAFGGTYDFFYLPMDVKNNANVGYAFVNFLTHADYTKFTQYFEGYHFKRGGSKKIAAVSSATVQGLKMNVDFLMKKRVAQGQYGPCVLRDGRRVELEEAARMLSSAP